MIRAIPGKDNGAQTQCCLLNPLADKTIEPGAKLMFPFASLREIVFSHHMHPFRIIFDAWQRRSW